MRVCHSSLPVFAIPTNQPGRRSVAGPAPISSLPPFKAGVVQPVFARHRKDLRSMLWHSAMSQFGLL
jgi:hypothetical protein